MKKRINKDLEQKNQNIKSCYIHIPFCKEICSYCDFCKMYYQKDLVDKYLLALEKEIQKEYQGDILSTIYIGGGTPNCLNVRQLKKLFAILKPLKKSPNIEFSIELNPECIDAKKLKILKENGINRISIGIESINKENQEFMQRKISQQKIKEKINLVQSYGWNNINLDLMYGFPDENLSTLNSDLSFLLSLQPKHISTYSLMIEKHTKIFNQKITPISEDIEAKMYKRICKTLKENGYIHYEISNFCQKGYESKHNLCYWNNEQYYGFGLGAASYLENKRKINTKNINNYIKGNACLEIENLTQKDKIIYQIILNLRLKEGLNKEKFQLMYQKGINELYNYQELIQNKWLKEDRKKLFIPEKKWYISNSILIQLLEGEVQ